MPHGYCYQWVEWIFWTTFLGDLITFLSYGSGFFALLYFYVKRPDIEKRWIVLGFAVFILACGIVHGLQAVSAFRGIYATVGIFKGIMALVSAPVNILVWPVVLYGVKLPDLSAYRVLESEINKLEIERKATKVKLRDMMKEQYRLKEENARLSNSEE